MKKIIEETIFYLRWLFLKLQDWQYYKENLVLSQKLFIKELYNAGVYLNLAEEIYID